MLAILFIFLLVIGLYVNILIIDAEKLAKLTEKYRLKENYFNADIAFTCLLKILLNYIQMIGAFIQLDLQLPDMIYQYYNLSSLIGTSPTQLVQIDCVIADLNLNFSSNFFLSIALVVPFIFYFFVFSGIIIFQIKKQSKKRIYRRIITAFIIINISIQPFLVKESFSALQCIELYNNKKFLVYDLNIECYSKQHYELV